MSSEQVLFFLLLVALPLLERLIRALRARPAGSVDRPPAPAPESVSRPSPLPPAPTQVISHGAPEQLRVLERKPRPQAAKHPPVTSLQTGQRAERPTALRRVIAGGDLRTAIVVMAVLGPCRALEPEDASPSSRG